MRITLPVIGFDAPLRGCVDCKLNCSDPDFNHDAVVNSQFGSSYTIIEDEFRIASVFRITIFGLQVLIYYLSNNWRYYLRRNNCVADADSQMPNDSNHLINFYYIEQVFENQAKKLEFVKPKIIFFNI